MNTVLYAPRIQPDETIYSYLARYQFLWGIKNSRVVSRQWFGRASVSINQLLPCELQSVASLSDYTPTLLLHKHTLFDLFCCFTKRRIELEKVMIGNSALALANRATLAHLGCRELARSKFCPECYREDVQRMGCGYWHLSHQATGVRACHIHKCGLISQETSSRKFTLPSLVKITEPAPVPVMQVAFAEYISSIVKSPKSLLLSPSGIEYIHPVFRKGKNLDIRGLLHYLDAIERGLQVPKLITESCLRKMIRIHNEPVHPFKGLLLGFAFKYLSNEQANNTSSIDGCDCRVKTKRCTALLNEHKYSLRDISRRVGVSVGFVKQLAKRLEIPIDSRFQRITPDIERKIISLAIKGDDRKAIAQQFDLSVGAVEQIIQSVKGLTTWRQYLRMLEKRNTARSRLTEVIKNNAKCSRTQIRNLASREYAFLYKYDKHWLLSALPTNSKPEYHGAIMWIKRDIQVFTQLKKFIRSALLSGGSLPTKYAIDQQLGAHGWFTKALEKMPTCWRYYRRLEKKFSTTKGNRT
ncbi:TnsD family Tn7-like transposition protein [Alteromonas genovensis]|uniref:TnsD family Tn7-like transposition protein n=1 Tax=Alteromonas genovensis TaxID=471225 RepID=UPI002FE36A06